MNYLTLSMQYFEKKKNALEAQLIECRQVLEVFQTELTMQTPQFDVKVEPTGIINLADTEPQDGLDGIYYRCLGSFNGKELQKIRDTYVSVSKEKQTLKFRHELAKKFKTNVWAIARALGPLMGAPIRKRRNSSKQNSGFRQVSVSIG